MPEGYGQLFEVTPSKVKGHPEVNLVNLVGRTPDQSVMHCWGQRSCRVNQGSNCLGMPYGYQIWLEEALSRAYHIGRVKGQAGVTQRSNCLEMPYGHQI